MNSISALERLGNEADANKRSDKAVQDPDLWALEDVFPDLSELLAPSATFSARDDDTVIVLDTNVLLLPFDVSKERLEQIEAVYRKLADEERLFVPGRVIREFLKNRDVCLAEIVRKLNEIKSSEVVAKLDTPPLLSGLSETEAMVAASGSTTALGLRVSTAALRPPRLTGSALGIRLGVDTAPLRPSDSTIALGLRVSTTALRPLRLSGCALGIRLGVGTAPLRLSGSTAALGLRASTILRMSVSFTALGSRSAATTRLLCRFMEDKSLHRIMETIDSSPHNYISRRTITPTAEVTAEPSNLDEVIRQCLLPRLLARLVSNLEIEHLNFRLCQRGFRFCTWHYPIELRHKKYPPSNDVLRRDHLCQPLRRSKLRLLNSTTRLQDLVKGFNIPSQRVPLDFLNRLLARFDRQIRHESPFERLPFLPPGRLDCGDDRQGNRGVFPTFSNRWKNRKLAVLDLETYSFDTSFPIRNLNTMDPIDSNVVHYLLYSILVIVDATIYPRSDKNIRSHLQTPKQYRTFHRCLPPCRRHGRIAGGLRSFQWSTSDY